MKIHLNHNFENTIGIDNLLNAWQEFIKGKRNRKDVQEFSFYLMDNILQLNYYLINLTYKHGTYKAFNISDPKPRNIHKATVRDRVLHHLIYKELYPYFDKKFIHDSYSCRLNKGTHKAINRFRYFSNKVSKNNTRTCWVLKCDIKKFFANINHKILMRILERYISNKDIIWLLEKVIESFYSTKPNTGLPLGNLTSQLFVNIYMNEFDQFVKHRLKINYYIRYADDFVILSDDKQKLENLIFQISRFLNEKLELQSHPDKVFIKTLNSGVDFLGWIHFPTYRILRTTTKRRMFNRVKESSTPETLNSYLGLLGHGDTFKIREKMLNIYYSSNV